MHFKIIDVGCCYYHFFFVIFTALSKKCGHTTIKLVIVMKEAFYSEMHNLLGAQERPTHFQSSPRRGIILTP